nr:nucleotidyltransferase domain-containing protein [bacterium]
MLLEQHLRILKSLKGEVRQTYKADLKGVFGSYVRGEAKEDSDIDILVEFQEGATLF